MPLLDDLYGPQRSLPVRQQEQADLEQRAALAGVSPQRQQATDDQKKQPTQSPSDDLLQSLVGPLTKLPSIDSLLGTSTTTPSATDLFANRTTSTTTPAPATTAQGASPIIGTKNYKTGSGDPSVRALAAGVSQTMGWDQAQFAAWDALINAESGWRPNAQNPTSTAYGLGQFLNSTWKGYGAKTSDPGQQLAYMAQYIKQRYGTPEKALAFHAKNHWY